MHRNTVHRTLRQLFETPVEVDDNIRRMQRRSGPLDRDEGWSLVMFHAKIGIEIVNDFKVGISK